MTYAVIIDNIVDSIIDWHDKMQPVDAGNIKYINITNRNDNITIGDKYSNGSFIQKSKITRINEQKNKMLHELKMRTNHAIIKGHDGVLYKPHDQLNILASGDSKAISTMNTFIQNKRSQFTTIKSKIDLATTQEELLAIDLTIQ